MKATPFQGNSTQEIETLLESSLIQQNYVACLNHPFFF